MDLHRFFNFCIPFIVNLLAPLRLSAYLINCLSTLETLLSNISRTNWTLSYMIMVRNLFLFLPCFNASFSTYPWDIASCVVVNFWLVKLKQTFSLNIWFSFKNQTSCGYSLYFLINYLIWFSNWDIVLKSLCKKVQHFLWTHISLSGPL